MEIAERIELWFSLYGDDCQDSDVRDLLNEAQQEIERLHKIESAIVALFFWFNDNGEPVDGFRFREEAAKVESMLKDKIEAYRKRPVDAGGVQ